jgi:hypothetical protein
MTPLAAHLAKQLTARPKHRVGIWREPKNLNNLRDTLHDIHCFEVTACLNVVVDTYNGFKRKTAEQCEEVFETFSFLPAPKTWIEWLHFSGNRIGIAVEQKDDAENDKPPFVGKPRAECTLFDKDGAVNLGLISTQSGDYYHYGGDQYWPNFVVEAAQGVYPAPGFLAFTHVMLVLINSPRIIGRRQYMPNVGLERELTRGFGRGKFPLHAWTEIRLEVAKPPEIDDGEPHEAHLTGRRALHFCRKHIRIRYGQLEYVSAHWRGDPALGIKRARYSVRPGRLSA